MRGGWHKESEPPPSFGLGDRVLFVRTHHAHNADLKTHRGETGTVRSIDSEGAALVSFPRQDKNFGTYWIGPLWLRKVRP